MILISAYCLASKPGVCVYIYTHMKEHFTCLNDLSH
jgi:pentatricopeptide repeat protein